MLAGAEEPDRSWLLLRWQVTPVSGLPMEPGSPTSTRGNAAPSR